MTTITDPELSPLTTPMASQTRFSTVARFQPRTHLIPTPGSFKKAQRYNPIHFWLPLTVGIPALYFALAIAVEIGIAVSNKNSGIGVPPTNFFQLLSQQFLLSFFPNLLIIPLAVQLRELDWHLRWYHPYVLLSKGNAKAEESLLMDYIHAGPVSSLLYSTKFGHRVVFWSALAGLGTYGLQPLAGALFTITQMPHSQRTPVTSVSQIGLNDQNIQDRTVFSASAGFVQTAVFNSLPDPPFIETSWAVAEFVFPTYAGFNGSVSLGTTAVNTDLHCDNPKSTPTITNNTAGNLVIVAQSATNTDCQVTVELDETALTQQYGVVAQGVNGTSSCTSITEIEKQPVMFWFFHTRADNNAQEARAVFCSLNISAFNVDASANLVNGNLTAVENTTPYTQGNNVTGSQAFNAVVFPQNPNNFIQARQTATNNGVPGAIFRSAIQDSKGVQGIFDEANGFLDLTTTKYTQHLALTAKGIYFVPLNQTMSGVKTSSVPRLVVNELPGHLLALQLIVVGAITLVVQLIQRRRRASLLLAAPPGSIASTAALTAHSGFGTILYPYDNAEALEKKLRTLRFRLDQRTGAIVAEDAPDDDDAITLKEKDQTKHSLLRKGRSQTESSAGQDDSRSWAMRSTTSVLGSSEDSTYVDHNNVVTVPVLGAGPSGSRTAYRPMTLQPQASSSTAYLTEAGYPPQPRSA